MERWITAVHKDGEVEEVDKFLAEIIGVCRKHNMWLSHEDGHGAFEIVNKDTSDWLNAAHDARGAA